MQEYHMLISLYYLKPYLMNIDKSVYNRNIILLTPMNKIQKVDVVPQLVHGELFDNCAIYIKEDYIYLDLK